LLSSLCFPGAGKKRSFLLKTGQDEHAGSPLHRVVQWFKIMTANVYICDVKQNGWPPFPGKLWQRNYYEHIICLSAYRHAQADNETELDNIRQYIINKPLNCQSDENY